MNPHDASHSPTPVVDASPVVGRHATPLMALPGVVGVSAGMTGRRPEPCVRVHLLRGYSGTRAAIPSKLEGLPVVVELTDPIRPLGR